MLKYIEGQTIEELNYNWTLADLKEFAIELKIKCIYKMNKLQLCMSIDNELKKKINHV